MSGQLRDIASELAEVLWREHTVYRDRSGGVVIRGEHVQRWISLAPAGGRGEILVRAGRILDGGTTAPARSEAIVPLAAGTGELATTCRRLLAEAAVDAAPRVPGGPSRAGRSKGADGSGRSRRSGRISRSGKQRRRGRHTSFSSWVVLVCVAGVVALYLYSAGAFGR
ncbi:hypothetical protein J7E96_13925 [Streptomyces sp. ISL-96]|uniref:hypothetical protein n=1 Tax=Streptomyces sp. ISL-96 TaxID=2819191 RepID=UPI001BEA0652|nr:hypothetical protein [Streptomyces sp. ISL-96]MBT2489596.1 hypothetical protein [Streptomyces sp. ISL-96]